MIVNGRFDPREGEAGLKQLEEDAKRYDLKGVKVYTAEWHNGSRGWKLNDPEAQFFLDKCKELGIKNIHAHKGPTIWPLDKDGFDHKDIDVAATSNPELNFIVEHVGLPRIDDFCFMATQEPNVYAGLAVVIGALMHARPRFFNRVMGELLFWVGEDKMLFGSDYAIWEPKWQVEGFVNWTMPDQRGVRRTTRAVTTATKKKIMGLNAAKLYDIDVPAELQLHDEAPAAQEERSSSSRHDQAKASPSGAADKSRVPHPSWTRSPRSTIPSSMSRSPRSDSWPRARSAPRATWRSSCSCPRRSAPPISRSSWQPTRAAPCAGCRTCAR